MANRLDLQGFKALKDELAALPSKSKEQAAPILQSHAARAQAELRSIYPSVTGQLRAGVQVVQRVARGVAAFYALVSTAPYAHIYEFGSTRTRPHAAFLPVSERQRREAVVAVAAMVESTGLEVRGARD